ncbi:hypothetical protein RI129_002423 [Pyrocoelia pectoralis]|uniref:Uncharacterized protein n=1 Tax=Pyrocoelia pectoralis TaxID=417401 RepID=A0AAN7VLG5_9COLE
MKFVIFLVLFVGLTTCEETTENPLDNDKEKCIVELGLKRDEIIELDNLDFPPDSNSNYNKFVECDSKKKGLMSPKGEILFPEIKKMLLEVPEAKQLSKITFNIYKHIISEALRPCEEITLTTTDPGANMIRVYTCATKEIMKLKESLV